MTQVNIAAESGDMGVLANHVASIESLKPGVVEVIENQGDSKKWFGKHQSSLQDWNMNFLQLYSNSSSH